MPDEIEMESCVTFIFQVKDLTKFLDPSGLGVISFEDFHRGISAISNGGESWRPGMLHLVSKPLHLLLPLLNS